MKVISAVALSAALLLGVGACAARSTSGTATPSRVAVTPSTATAIFGPSAASTVIKTVTAVLPTPSSRPTPGTTAARVPPSPVSTCGATSYCPVVAHKALSGGMDITVENRDRAKIFVTESINGTAISQLSDDPFGPVTTLDCEPTAGVTVCSISGVPGAHVGFASVFRVTPQGLTSLRSRIFGEGEFSFIPLEDGTAMLTSWVLFTDTGISPAMASAAWQTWQVTATGVTQTGCGVPTAHRTGIRPTGLLHGACPSGTPAAGLPASGPTRPPASGTTTIAAAVPDTSVPAVARDPAVLGPVAAGQPADPSLYTDAAGSTAAFASPSGNIQCSLYRNFPGVGDTAICQIDQHKYISPPRPSADCQGVYGQTADVSVGKGANAECRSDPVPRTAAILSYGQSLTLGAVGCLSTKSGVRCESSTGQGFILSQSEFIIFN